MSLNGGYAMIKYNSTQEELQIAYRSKRPALFYDENQRAHWAVIEETATQSVDEETQEPITLYEYSYKLLDEASGGSNLLEDIVDSKGNKRFIEGQGINSTNPNITTLYNRWSLSGTHLMCVLVFKIGNVNINKNEVLSKYVLPEFIRNKIITADDDTALVTRVYAGANNLRVDVIKVGDELKFLNLGDTYVNSWYRIQCDLLIDNE